MVTDRLIHIHVPRTGGSTFRGILNRIPGLTIVDDAAHARYGDMIRWFQRPAPPAVVFIRNPWDWYVSQWLRNLQISYEGFADSFVQHMTIIRENRVPNWNFKTLTFAWEWLQADNARYIGRFESVEDDMIRSILAVASDLVTSRELHTIIEKLGKSRLAPGPKGQDRKPYWEYYDERLISWVAEWDKNLIARFGYQYGK